MDDTALVEGRGFHAALYLLHDRDVFCLQDFVKVTNGFGFHRVRFRGFQVKVVSLQGAFRPCRNDVNDNHRAAPRIAHQTGCWPQPPHRVRAHTRLRDVVSLVGTLARISHMAGIDAVSGHLIGIHVYQGAKVFVRDRAVITLQEVVDHVLPVRPDVVSQSVTKSQVAYVRRPECDLGAEVARLFGEWPSRRVQVDIHEATELFHLHLIQTDVINIEVLQDFSARRAYQLASQ